MANIVLCSATRSGKGFKTIAIANQAAGKADVPQAMIITDRATDGKR